MIWVWMMRSSNGSSSLEGVLGLEVPVRTIVLITINSSNSLSMEVVVVAKNITASSLLHTWPVITRQRVMVAVMV